MLLNNTSFDAVITDIHGRSIEVDCRVTEPAVSGLPAAISIEIPLSGQQLGELKNPCILSGKNDGFDIEIKDLWYRQIPAGTTNRKHARGIFNINHARHLLIRNRHFKNKQRKIRFLLSPVRFFKAHSNASMINYADTPNMTVELFTLHAAEFGEVRFIKYWTIHHVHKNGVAAEIRAGFAAEIELQELTPLSDGQLVEKMKSVLIPLSILTRQAITLHGWVSEKQDGIETMWLNPLDPNLAPDMAEESQQHVCFPDEFCKSAQSLIEKFIDAPKDIQEVINLISVALAPHVKRSTAGNFSALFCALEQVIKLNKLTDAEKEKLKETDKEFFMALDDLKDRYKDTTIKERIEGLVKDTKERGPSFKVLFQKLHTVYPQLDIYMGDLWPVFGTKKSPGLKDIRNSLAHGLQAAYNPQAIAVAHWHFSRLAERLAFILLDIPVPKGIQLNSLLLTSDQWYAPAYWQAIRTSAKCENNY